MPNELSRDEKLGLHYLSILEEAEAAGTAEGIPVAKPDDTNGRVTGKWECTICGMRYIERDDAADCCWPAFKAHGIDPYGPSRSHQREDWAAFEDPTEGESGPGPL